MALSNSIPQPELAGGAGGSLRWTAPIVLAVALVGAALYFGAASVYRDQALDRLTARVELFATTLTDALERFQHLPVVLGADPEILTVLSGDTARANLRLAELAAATGVEAIYVLNPDGLTIAASNHDRPGSFLGQNYQFRPYFQDALSGQAGEFYAIGATTSRPGYFVAGPIRRGGTVVAVLAVKIDLSPLTSTWRDSGERVLATNADGVVTLSSVDGLRYRATQAITPERRVEIDAERQFGAEPLSPLSWRDVGAGELAVDGAGYLHASLPIDRLGWRLHGLQPREAVDQGALTALIAYAVVLALGALVWLYRRSRRIDQALQSSLSERDALSALNVRLETEITERALAEKALRETQEELSRAGRLAALGRLAATVTHELGQPLSAMRNYLAAAEITNDPSDLPARLAPVVERMEATTAELRGFSRSGGAPAEVIDLNTVTATAIDLMTHDLEALGVTLTHTPPPAPVFVKGDKLRLEQVWINILKNAVQAVSEAEQKAIDVSLAAADGEARLTIGDSGPGLGDATLEALTEPFHTTRAAGMGLGLSICHAIVQDHGGALGAGVSPLGGAAFTVALPLEDQAT